MSAAEIALDELRRSLAMCESAAVAFAPGDTLGQLAFRAGWLKRTVESAIATLEIEERRKRAA